MLILRGRRKLSYASGSTGEGVRTAGLFSDDGAFCTLHGSVRPSSPPYCSNLYMGPALFVLKRFSHAQDADHLRWPRF